MSPERSLDSSVAPATTLGDARQPLRAGLLILGVCGLALGTWSALAPVSSAVIAPAVVKVEGNRKSVQHLDGGIVKVLHAKEGVRVAAGEPLIVLDDTQARATLTVLRKQHDDLRAQEARLAAERDGAAAVVFPDALTSRRDDPDVTTLLAAQTHLHASRQSTLAGQIGLLRQKVAQTRAQISGDRAVLAAREQQLKSTQGEVAGLRDLFRQGYVPRQRMLELERAAAELEGGVGGVKGSIAKGEQAIAEATLQMEQLQVDRAAQIATDLREVQAKRAELGPRLQAAEDVAARTVIRAPYAGEVVGMMVFSVGGVIQRGEKLMDIVPESGTLAVEATVNVEDIEGLAAGMAAEVRVNTYAQRRTPALKATVTQVSADRLTDTRSGASYYSVLAKVDAADLARHGNLRLAPGMSATLVVPTGERSVLDYLMKPLTDSVNQAMREK